MANNKQQDPSTGFSEKGIPESGRDYRDRDSQVIAVWSAAMHRISLQVRNCQNLYAFKQKQTLPLQFTMYSVLRSKGCQAAGVVDTEDTDNYVQAAYVAHRTPGILSIKRKHQLIDAKRLCSEEISQSIISVHVISGCDHNSGFFGASKLMIVGRLAKSKEAQKLLLSCGAQLPCPPNVISDLEKFVIRFVYGDSNSVTLGIARANKWRGQRKKNTMRLIPDADSLHHHLLRTNYLAYLLTNFHLQSHPSPISHGWHLVNGLCLPVRSTQPPLPLSMAKPNTEVNCEESSSDEDSASDSASSYSDSFIDSESSSDSDV